MKGGSALRVALSGTGRIGRLCIRNILSRHLPDIEFVAINSTCTPSMLAHLLKYDTVHGTWDAQIEASDNVLCINGRTIQMLSERSPALLPWMQMEVDLVIDATGAFNHRTGAEQHLAAGAKRVLITAPGKEMDLTIVMGVNEYRYNPTHHRLLSAASCTTNCLAPVLHILDQSFGVKSGWMTTIHSYTNDQNHIDNPHKDMRRARSCSQSMIPTSTGAGKALIDVLPHLAPVMNGMSVRVPVQDVSLLDLQVQLKRQVQATDVQQAFRDADNSPMGAYVSYNELPLVSADYIGNNKSAIVDGLSIMVREDQVKLLAWYDNEWAYASRVIDLAAYIVKAEQDLQDSKEQTSYRTEMQKSSLLAASRS